MRFIVTFAILVSAIGMHSGVALGEPEILSDSQRARQRLEEYRARQKKEREEDMASMKQSMELKLGDFGSTTLTPKKVDEKTGEIVLQTNRWYGVTYQGGTYYNYRGERLYSVPERTVKQGYYELRLRPDGRGGYSGRLVGKDGEVKETFSEIDRKVFQR